MVYAFTGNSSEDRMMMIRLWCKDKFGPELWPIHNGVGKWRFGSVTLYGWTFIGFEAEAMLEKFLAVWHDAVWENSQK
jgi:hypothetical protein